MPASAPEPGCGCRAHAMRSAGAAAVRASPAVQRRGAATRGSRKSDAVAARVSTMQAGKNAM